MVENKGRKEKDRKQKGQSTFQQWKHKNCNL